MSENTQVKLSDPFGEDRYFTSLEKLEVYLGDVASVEYTNEVLSRLRRGEQHVVIMNGGETDAYEFMVVKAVEISNMDELDAATVATVAELAEAAVTTAKFVAQYVPAGSQRGSRATWVDVQPECTTLDDAESLIAENIKQWNAVRKDAQRQRPTRYHVVYRVVREIVVTEVTDDDGNGE